MDQTIQENNISQDTTISSPAGAVESQPAQIEPIQTQPMEINTIGTTQMPADTTSAIPAPPEPMGIMSFFPFILVIAIFYFFIFRPQKNRMKEHGNLLDNLKKGDKVVTSGGIIGVVHKINNDATVNLEISDNVNIKIEKSSISRLYHAEKEA